MNINIKKTVSIILAVIMILSVAAAGIGAVSAAYGEMVYTEGVYRYTVSNGEATITGNIGVIGDVTLPATLGGYPVTGIGKNAFQYAGSLTSVVIPASIETIEASAFINASLKKVTFEDNGKLKTLNNTVFINCDALETVDFGQNSSIEAIGESAFVNCKALKSIVLPDSVKSIGKTVFENCISLEQISIPANVTEIGKGTFSNCQSLEKVVVSKDNPSFTSDEQGILFNKEKTKIIVYPAGNKKTEYVIPAYINEIEVNAFKGQKYLEELIWTNSNMKVGISAFASCESLYRVSIPEGVTYLMDWMFDACFSLKEVDLPESLEIIGCGVFHYCVGLEEIELPSGLVSINDNAFRECAALKKVVLPEGLKKIYPRAFEQCLSLENINIPESVTYIGSTAFYQCYSLKEIVFPESVININGDVLRHCTSLESFKLPDNTKIIDKGAFFDCRKLKTLSIPASVSTVTGASFRNCNSLESVSVDADNLYFAAGSDGILFSKNKNELVYYPAAKKESVYTVPDLVTVIGGYAFDNAQNLAAIVIPDSVTSIEAYAFNGCNIRDIYFEGTQEEWNAFAEAANVTAAVHFNHTDADHVHEYSQQIATAPDCSNTGKKSFACSCGESAEVDYHYGTGRLLCEDISFEWVDVSASDCSQPGKRTLCCTECGKVFATVSIAKPAHDIDITVSDASKAIEYDCKNCEYAYSEVIPEGKKYIYYNYGTAEKIHLYDAGDKIGLPKEPEKKGLSFFGWADESGNRVELNIMPDSNLALVPTFGSIVKADSADITFVYDEGCFDENAKMSVEKINGTNEPGGFYFNEQKYQQIALYNIKAVNESGEAIQPQSGKKVTVKIALPDEYKNKKDFIVNHWLTNGKREQFRTADGTVKIENGYLVFETGGFSEFEIFAKPAITVSKSPDKTVYTYKGSKVDLSGIVIKCDSGETVTDISKINVIKDIDTSKIGEQTVVIECDNSQAEFTVTVEYAWWQWIIRILLLGFIWY